VAWLHERHPSTQAASTRKKGRAALSQLFKYAIANEWAKDSLVGALPPAYPSPDRREWLRPEQTAALDALVRVPRFNAYQRLMWSCLLNTGVRPEELVGLKPNSLNRTDGTLKVVGKGRGDGKPRLIPVSADFQEEYSAFVLGHALAPSSWLFPRMQIRFVPGVRFAHEYDVADGNHHCTTKAVRTAIARVRDAAEDAVKQGAMDPALLPSFSLTPKVLRRTYACTNLIMSAELGHEYGLDIRSLQDALGHESLDTTAIYLSDVSAYLNRRRTVVSISTGVGALAASGPPRPGNAEPPPRVANTTAAARRHTKVRRARAPA
jgi:integrase